MGWTGLALDVPKRIFKSLANIAAFFLQASYRDFGTIRNSRGWSIFKGTLAREHHWLWCREVDLSTVFHLDLAW
ncbi:unnamed protein product [Calypogeia fissa]